jgi:hypothetical protein
MFENPTLVGLADTRHPRDVHIDRCGKSFTKAQVIRQITDPCFFVDPVYGRCVMDGFAGARTDLSAAPSIDIANGAPTGAGATNEIVAAWADGGSDVNDNKTLLSWSVNGGTTWSPAATVSLAGDRPLYAAPAISPAGDKLYVVYEADTAPWRGANMTSPRPYHGVFLTAPVGAGGAPASWSTVYNGSTDTSAGHNDLRERIPATTSIKSESATTSTPSQLRATEQQCGRMRKTRPSAGPCRRTAPRRFRPADGRYRRLGRSPCAQPRSGTPTPGRRQPAEQLIRRRGGTGRPS